MELETLTLVCACEINDESSNNFNSLSESKIGGEMRE